MLGSPVRWLLLLYWLLNTILQKNKMGFRIRATQLGRSGTVLCCCAQSCPTLCDPIDCILPGSSIRGILQARILEWGCHALLQGIFLIQVSNLCLTSPALAGRFFTTSTTWEAQWSRDLNPTLSVSTVSPVSSDAHPAPRCLGMSWRVSHPVHKSNIKKLRWSSS